MKEWWLVWAGTVVAVGGLSVGCSESNSAGDGGEVAWPPDATVYLDQYGIPHIDCATDEDCAMTLGYQHAVDRFAQMDLRRRLPTGRLTDILDKGVAELFEVPAAAAHSRALFLTREGKPIEEVWLEHASEKTLALLKAYSAGVNRWIEDVRNGDNGTTFPRELSNPLFVYEPEDIPEWTPIDSAAVMVLFLDRVTNFEASEVANGRARADIANDDRFSDLWNVAPVIPLSILKPGWQPPATSKAQAQAESYWRTLGKPLNAAPAIRQLDDRLKRMAEVRDFLFGDSAPIREGGSNNWVVAPSRTVDGNALLANDPHLELTQPALWYLAHLDARTNGRGDIHAAGGTLVGFPSVILGQNEHAAWGATMAFMDLNDLYIEELVKSEDGDPIGVMFQGEMVPFTRVSFPIRFSDGSEDTQEILIVPHHGPVRELDPANDVAVTLRWTGHDATTDINMFTQMNRASSVEEIRVALTNSTSAGICWVVADAAGDIAFFPYVRPPKRDWATDLNGPAPPWVPIDGRGDYEWTEFWDHAELPQAVNPESGFVATANNDITGHLFDGDPTNDGYPLLQTNVHSGFRLSRIVEMIEGVDDKHTVDTMRAIQRDTRLRVAEDVLPRFLELASSEEVTLTERATKVRDALSEWNLTCPTGLAGPYMDSPLTDDLEERREAIGCATFHSVFYYCGAAILGGERGRSDPSGAYYFTLVDPTKLAAGDVYWDDPQTPEIETDFEIVEECFDEAARRLIEDRGLGDDEAQWVWGRAQGLQLFSDFAAFEIHDYDNPAPGNALFANDGGFHSVDPNNPGFDWTQTDGASLRFVCELFPTGPKCTFELPGGQSGDVDSGHYDDLLFKWLENEGVELLFDIEEAKKQAVRTFALE